MTTTIKLLLQEDPLSGLFPGLQSSHFTITEETTGGGGGQIIFYDRIVAGRIFFDGFSAAVNFSAAVANYIRLFTTEVEIKISNKIQYRNTDRQTERQSKLGLAWS